MLNSVGGVWGVDKDGAYVSSKGSWRVSEGVS
jgi:hypothetical protein